MNITIINFLRIGDLYQSYLLLNNLKMQYPKAEINYLTANQGIDIFQKVGLCQITNFDLKNFFYKSLELNLFDFLESLKKTLTDDFWQNFDLVINLNNLDLAIQIEKFIAKKALFSAEYNQFIRLFAEFKNKAIFNLAELNLTFLPSSNYLFSYYLEQPLPNEPLPAFDKNYKYLAFNIDTGEKIREIELDFFLINIKKLLERKNLKIILTGRNKMRANYLTTKIHSDRLIDLSSQTSLLELFGILKKIDLFISADTGTIHLAALANCKILGLYYLSAYPFLTGAYSSKAYYLYPEISCFPCQEHFQPCKGEFFCKKFFLRDISSYIYHLIFEEKLIGHQNLNFIKSEIDPKIGQLYRALDLKNNADFRIKMNYLKIYKEQLLGISMNYDLYRENLFWDTFANLYQQLPNSKMEICKFLAENNQQELLIIFKGKNL